MKKKTKSPLWIFGIIIVLAILVVGRDYYLPDKILETSQIANNSLTLEQLKNIEYTVYEGRKVLLKNGRYTKEYPGMAETFDAGIFNNLVASGDLNNDGKKDAAVIIDYQGGGSGHSYNIAIVLNNNGKAEFAAFKLLGDRIEIDSIKITNGIIFIEGTFSRKVCSNNTCVCLDDLDVNNTTCVKSVNKYAFYNGQISQWRTYVNEEYKFRFEYPDSWHFDSSINKSLVAFRGDPTKFGCITALSVLDEDMSTLEKKIESNYSSPSNQLISKKDFYIDGYKGTEYRTVGYEDGFMGISILFSNNGKTYIFNSCNENITEDLFYKMISTFRFN